MTYVSQMSLITAILGELEAQEPGTEISQFQMNAIIGAADLIVAALRNPAPTTEKMLKEIVADCSTFQEI